MAPRSLPSLLLCVVLVACNGGAGSGSMSATTGATETGGHSSTSAASTGTSDGATSSTGSSASSDSTTDFDTDATTGPCPHVEVTPGGPLGCDGAELSLDGTCMQLAGYEECAGGSVHRHTQVQCNQGPRETACGGGGGLCTQDADCVQYANGRCVDDFGCRCRYQCTTDAECGPGAACVCELYYGVDDPALLGLDACVPANCHTDAECGGRRCALSISKCFYVEGLYCHTADDECEDRFDCPPELPRCAYSIDDGRWLCQQYASCE